MDHEATLNSRQTASNPMQAATTQYGQKAISTNHLITAAP
jgi:hypothetical protein